MWLQLELTGHRLPSQASQQIVSRQHRHDVSGSVGGTADVRQDHWRGEEGREMRRAVPEPYVGLGSARKKNKEDPPHCSLFAFLPVSKLSSPRAARREGDRCAA